MLQAYPRNLLAWYDVLMDELKPCYDLSDLTRDQLLKAAWQMTEAWQNEGQCKVWVGLSHSTIKPSIVVDGWLIPARRLAYFLGRSGLHPDAVIEDTCGNASCLRVSHLVSYFPATGEGGAAFPPCLTSREVSEHQISSGRFKEIFSKQDGRCALCSASDPLQVDWDHRRCHSNLCSGACVAGLLCERCLAEVKPMRDDFEWQLKVMDYLTSMPHQ